MPDRYTFEHIDGLFRLSEWDEDVKGPFGLHPPPGDWASFTRGITDLQAKCGEGEEIKVIYAARHGQAEHNLLGEKYGYAEANRRFPVVDPELTPLGREQAGNLGKAFRREIERGMPSPSAWFVSPLRRCGQTLELEWGWYAQENNGKVFEATVIEGLREHLLIEECNRRLKLSELKKRFLKWTWPENMTEEDHIYERQVEIGHTEVEEALRERTRKAITLLLDQAKGHTYISVTSHSGALRGVWYNLGVPTRRLVVGEMNVLVVKVKKERN